MPVVQKLMSALQARYGEKQGESVYYAMEAEGSGPFGPRGKYHALHQSFASKHNLKAIESPGKKKPPTRKAGGKRR